MLYEHVETLKRQSLFKVVEVKACLSFIKTPASLFISVKFMRIAVEKSGSCFWFRYVCLLSHVFDVVNFVMKRQSLTNRLTSPSNCEHQ